MAAARDKRDVAPAEEVRSNLPAELLELAQGDSGSGVSGMTSDDVAVPYLYILQSNSPQVNEDHELYVEGARAGMFYNNVSGEVFDGREVGLEVIPCAYERKYVEWVDRDKGGGYVADHAVDSGILQETQPDARGRPVLGNGNFIVETAYHYVYMKNPNTGAWEEIIIPMKSTFLKKSRRWNKSLTTTVIPGSSLQAPRWLYPYRLKTVKEQKDNNTWSNYEIVRENDPVTVEQYQAAKKFAELFTSGLVVRAKETDTGTTAAGSSGGGADKDDDMPF
jgi:hypothetical protein